jgi:hypothetical protein
VTAPKPNAELAYKVLDHMVKEIFGPRSGGAS